MFGAERNRVLDGPKQLFSVAQQEEEQIQHDEKSDDDLECGLADIDGLGGEELASSQENVGQSLLHRGKVGQPEAIEQTSHPCRQGVQDLLKIAGEIQVSGAELSYRPDASCTSDAVISVAGRMTMATMIATVARAARLRRCFMDFASR